MTKRIMTTLIAASLAFSSMAMTEAHAKKAGAKFKDLTPELQQVVLAEINKFSQHDLIMLYLEKASPRDLLVIINASGTSKPKN